MHRWPLVDIQPLEKVKLDKSLDKEKYQRELEACREKLEDLHNQLKNVRITGTDGTALLGEIVEG